MKIERTKNASQNIVFGLLLRLQQTVLPFLIRTVMIRYMGEQYLGLNSLFTSILHILNLAELGVGSAMVFSMYKPIAEDDEATICALMKLYRRYYRLIGMIIGVIGCLLTPAIPHLISGEVPGELNVYVLYWLNLGATVLTYWLFAYKNCLLQAHQRSDKISLVSMTIGVLQFAAQFAVLIFTKNYYFYLIVALVTQVLTNLSTAYVAGKMYPQYSPKGKLNREDTRKINGKIRDLFTSKVGGVILSSSDAVVISAFLGLSILGIYQNYYFILTAIIGIVETMLQSVIAGLGNSFVTETKEKNYNDLKKFTFVFMWVTGICVCCFLGLYQPFMRIWVGEALMLESGAVVCFAVYFFLFTIYRLINIYKDAAGLWHEDRFRPLITAVINLILNLLWIKPLGIYGVLLSTILSILVVGMPWVLRNLFTFFFAKEQLWRYIKQILGFTLAAAAAGGVSCLLCQFFTGNLWVSLLVRGMICVIVPNLLFLLLLHRNEQFRPGVQMVDRLTHHKLRLEQRLFPTVTDKK